MANDPDGAVGADPSFSGFDAHARHCRADLLVEAVIIFDSPESVWSCIYLKIA